MSARVLPAVRLGILIPRGATLRCFTLHERSRLCKATNVQRDPPRSFGCEYRLILWNYSGFVTPIRSIRSESKPIARSDVRAKHHAANCPVGYHRADRFLRTLRAIRASVQPAQRKQTPPRGHLPRSAILPPMDPHLMRAHSAKRVNVMNDDNPSRLRSIPCRRVSHGSPRSGQKHYSNGQCAIGLRTR